MSNDMPERTLRTLIVDDEPLAVERLQVVCAQIPQISVAGTASDGQSALRLVEALTPDLVLLDMTMPQLDGLGVARKLAKGDHPPAVIFVTAHDNFALEAFDLDAVDYVLKPVEAGRLQRAIERALVRREHQETGADQRWLTEFWIPHRSELRRIDADHVHRIDAERDYVRLHVSETDGSQEGRSYLLLQTIAGLEQRLDPAVFIRVHRSTILRRDHISGLRHEGMGVWCAELTDGAAVRIGRTYLAKVKAMAGR